MFRFWRPNLAWAPCLSTAGALVVLLGVASSAQAAVTVTADPVDGYGASPVVFTVNPFDAAIAATERANRGIIADRHLRQTFKNPSTFNVGEINISFDVGTGSVVGGPNDTGLKLAFYEVADVLASTWTAGTLIKEVTLQPTLMPGSTQSLRFALTGGDVFTLPQRNAGTTGYGVEVSTPNALASDGNPGVLWFANMDATPGPETNFYLDGRYYTETGTGSTAYRDVGLSLLASNEVVCDPGDVNCMGGVTLDDLNIIAAHFRQSGGRELGDLSGNGFIDFDDFQQWKQNYPGAFPGGASGLFGSVPEPGCLVLWLSGTAGLVPFTRRRRRENVRTPVN